VVSSGENLTRIAQRYGTTAEAVAKMNGIDGKRPIFPGQKLRVPRGKTRSSKAGSKGTSQKKKEAIAYSVKKGDSLSTIAARHKISVAALLRANRIDAKKPLQIGQRLAIPVP
jgi:membrane-bound lytic murein transglycosylase D